MILGNESFERPQLLEHGNKWMMNIDKLYRPLEPGRSIHCSWSSTSPHSTFRNLRQMSWTTLPSVQTMQLSSARQFCLLGCTLEIMVPLGRPSKCIRKASRYGLMVNSASPILSSLLNVSWSYTVWKWTKIITINMWIGRKEKATNMPCCNCFSYGQLGVN